MRNFTEDTIAAVSTPHGEGGIGIVRLSGHGAVRIADSIFRATDKRKLKTVKTYTAHYGHIINPEETATKKNTSKNAVIDEVIVLVMLSPHSYTGEDVVEISCHGGMISVTKVLNACLHKGARHALPGEFTKRAFVNGRIDLVQAEAVCDIIQAKTERALFAALEQLQGHLSEKIYAVSRKILDLLANIEAAIDYSDENIDTPTTMHIIITINAIMREIKAIILSSRTGSLLRNGIQAVIVGKPNAGKSSLLNALLKESKAIVTSIPGTTRDIVHDMINIKGMPVQIMDTAGIRAPRDEVEKIGVSRSQKALKSADLVLFVVDLSVPLSREDREIAKSLKGKQYIIVANKTDISQKVNISQIKAAISREKPVIRTSAKKYTGISTLENMIAKQFLGRKELSDSVMMTNLRHMHALERTMGSLNSAKENAEQGFSEEFVALDLRKSLGFLGEITGETVNDKVLDIIFSQFCVGK